MRKFVSLLLALLLTAGTLGMPAQAAHEQEEPAPVVQTISPWAYDALADIYALGMWNDVYYYCILDPVTGEQMERIRGAVAEKLAVLNIAPHAGDLGALVVDNTRRGVKNALYQEAAAYEMPFVDQGVDAFFTQLGISRGDGTKNDIDGRTCSLQEALVLAARLVLALYDHYNAGSLGFLWKAEGNNVTLYLLGTIHVDRGNVYPFHRQLRSIITSADATIFEVNFNDAEDMAAFARMQLYRDGSTLADHIAADLYARVVEAFAGLGMTEAQTALYKPWALANTLQALAMTDDSTGDTFMVIDSYVNAAAVNAGVPIGAVESYEFQGTLFDTLSAGYQEAYLAAALSLYLGGESAAEPAPSDEPAPMDDWMSAWKTRNIDSFAASYQKDAILDGADELSRKLFTERDPHMIAAAAEFLANNTGAFSPEDPHKTILMVVGAGHMIGKTGIVQGLIDLGYAVEAVPAP